MRSEPAPPPSPLQDPPLTVREALTYAIWLSGIVGLMAVCMWAVPRYFQIF